MKKAELPMWGPGGKTLAAVSGTLSRRCEVPYCWSARPRMASSEMIGW
jgi:hypothetical protein